MLKVILIIVIALLVLIVVSWGIHYYMKYEKTQTDEYSFNKLEFSSSSTTHNLPNIEIVFDNNPYNEELKTSWGFACVIEKTEKTILFDSGGSGAILLENMEKLKINPRDINIVFLSHIHGDHVGGIYGFLEKNCEVTVYMPESFPEQFKKNIEEFGASVVKVSKPIKICNGVYSTGELGSGVKEQSLIIKTNKGLIIITGCAHPGIVSIVERSEQLMNDKVLLVMGGFHLSGYSLDEIESIVSAFKNLEVCYTGPCHCSGEAARRIFEHEYKQYYIDVGVGKIIEIEDLK